MNQNLIGSKFDDFLREEGILEEVERTAAQRVEAMKKTNEADKKENDIQESGQ